MTNKVATRYLLLSGIFFFAVAFGARRPASAVPSFADQTGQQCVSCHVGGFGPQLTPAGREFKLRGYTLRTKSSIPLAAMAVTSYVATKRAQDEPPAPGFSRNHNIALDEAAVFLAGGLGSHLGGFAEVTYDGVEKHWSWDNVDLRVVGTGKVGGKDLVYGLSLNNNPAIEDAWNTLPAWGFPFTDSALAPAPAAAPLIDGTLGQSVIGASAYAWFDSSIYAEVGGYTSPSRGTLRFLGADPFDPGDLHGVAPYGRVAYQTDLAGGRVEVGAFALKAAIFPGRDRSTGRSDRYSDVGVDASFIKSFKSTDMLTLNARYTHEKQSLDASCLLADPLTPLADCADNRLNELHADASYYWRNKIGATISAFDISGSRNPIIYADNRTGKPDSRGLQFQLDGTLFGKGNSPLGPLFNMRVGVQYTLYTRFNGARSNFDGTGRNASDNNTLRVFTWIAF